MIIRVDLASGASLEDEATFTAFHAVSSTDDNGIVGAAMGAAGHAADEPGHVWVSVDWIRSAADGDAVWVAGFDAMVGYAESKGWTNEAGSHIKAHLERP